MELAWLCWPCIIARGVQLGQRCHIEELEPNRGGAL